MVTRRLASRTKSVNPGGAAILSDAVAKHHIEHEEGTVGKGEYKADWLPTEAHICQKPSTTRCQHQGDDIARGPRPSAARVIGPRNSMAPTVPKGRREMAR